MARTIKTIKEKMDESLRASLPDVSESAVAEWNLWNYVVAAAIHAFEVIHDLFRKEIEDHTDRVIPGTLRWYAEKCYSYQYGHQLIYDRDTALYYYSQDDEQARIIKAAAIVEDENLERLAIKVAKLDKDGNITALAEEERIHFTNYMREISIAGIKTDVISSSPDLIDYQMYVYYDPSHDKDTVKKSVEEALMEFKTSMPFDSMFYTQKFVDAVLHCEGVVTVHLDRIKYIPSDGAESPVENFKRVKLFAGYVNFGTEEGTNLQYLPVDDIENKADEKL